MKSFIVLALCCIAWLQPSMALSDSLPPVGAPPSVTTPQKLPAYKPLTATERADLQDHSNTTPGLSQQRAGDYDGGPVDDWVFWWALLVVVAVGVVLL